MSNKFKTHVVLLSDNVLSIVLPALDYNLKPQRVVLCECDAMQEKGIGHRLTGFFKSNNIKVETFKLGVAAEFQDLHKKFSELAARYDDSTGSVAVNISGADQLMSTAAQSVFGVTGFTCIYAVPARNEMFTVRAAKVQRFDIQDKLKLNDYFQIHGCRLVAKREKNIKLMSGSHALCRDLLADFGKYSKHLPYLGRLASGAENHFSLRAKAKITLDNKPLFDLFHKHGFISGFDERIVKFSSDEDRSFCKGIWLEDYLHQTLKNISKGGGIQDFATCIKFVGSSGMHYELDAAFIVKNKLYVIEANTSRNGDRAGDDLFRMDAVSDFARENLCPIIITFRDLKNFEFKRAKRQGINLVQSSQISDIETKISDLLQLR